MLLKSRKCLLLDVRDSAQPTTGQNTLQGVRGLWPVTGSSIPSICHWSSKERELGIWFLGVVPVPSELALPGGGIPSCSMRFVVERELMLLFICFRITKRA